METIYETYVKKVCSTCKNKEACNEELRRRIDGSIRCEGYDSTFIPRKEVT